MQIDNNRINYKPSFGLIKVGYWADHACEMRLKSEEEWLELKKILKEQYHKRPNIHLEGVSDSNRLVAYIKDKRGNWHSYGENLIATYFSSPLKFIRKMCKKAEKFSQQ